MVGMKLGKERIYQYAKLLGFGEKTGIDLPGEVSGWMVPPERWSGTSIGAIPIGQEVAVTPLQVLRAYAAIANGGFLVRPHVVSEVISPDGQALVSFRNREKKRVLSARTAEIFKDILKSVVEEGGTGQSASVNGNEVAGKTGTAQMINPLTKRYSKEKYVSSFVGFVPADDPKLAIIVVVYEPKGQIYGGVVAAPVFRDIADKALSYLDIPREDIPRAECAAGNAMMLKQLLNGCEMPDRSRRKSRVLTGTYPGFRMIRGMSRTEISMWPYGARSTTAIISSGTFSGRASLQ